MAHDFQNWLLTGAAALAAAEPERVEALKTLMEEAHIPNPNFPVLKGE